MNTPDQLEQLLQEIPHVKPSLVFRMKLSARLFWHALFSDLSGHLLAKTVSFATASTALILTFALTVFLYDNSSVYAGSTFYGLKQVLEKLEFSLTAHSPEQESDAYLRLADHRKNELIALRSKVGEGSPAFKRTLYELVKDTNKALQAAKGSANPVAAKRKVSAAAAGHAAQLKSLPVRKDTDESGATGSGASVTSEGQSTGSGAEAASQEELALRAAKVLDNLANATTEKTDDRTVVPDESVPTVRE